MLSNHFDGKRILSFIKRAVGVVLPVAVCAASVGYIVSASAYTPALQLSIGGETVGFVESTDTVTLARSQLITMVNDATDGTYEADIDIEYELVNAKAPEFVDADTCYELMWSEINGDFTEAYMLYVDGEQVAASESEAELTALIDKIEEQLYDSIGVGFDTLRITSDIRIEKQLCLRSMLMSADMIDEAINPLAGVSAVSLIPEETAHSVEMTIASVTALSPNTNGAKSDETDGDDPTLDYNFINTITQNEVIPAEVVYQPDPSMLVGREKLLNEGANGEKAVTYELIYDENGKLISKTAISETITVPVTHKTILQGAKPIPAAVSTGEFIWPCERPKGVSSYFGWRDLYGKPDYHLGIDIPDVKGSLIWAADGGTVIFAGRTPSYGKNVQIQHANGYVTVYAHLDDIWVEVGDDIYPEQYIGTMGRTGVAYGVHLHFEIRHNGQVQNPLKYLPKN